MYYDIKGLSKYNVDIYIHTVYGLCKAWTKSQQWEYSNLNKECTLKYRLCILQPTLLILFHLALMKETCAWHIYIT